MIDSPSQVGEIEATVRELFELGGVLSGGGAVAYLYDKKTYDLDFFFNDPKAFDEATERFKDCLYVDVCFYKDLPYEGFDLTITECFVDSDGLIHASDDCWEAYRTSVCRIVRKNICNPHGTVRRVHKYQERYNLKFVEEDLEFLNERRSRSENRESCKRRP